MKKVEEAPVKGRFKEREEELRFPKIMPLAENARPAMLPESVSNFGYKVSFTKWIFGGLMADVHTDDGREVATNVKVRRWWEAKVVDPETGRTLMLKIGLLGSEALRMTLFEKGEAY